MLKKKIIKSVLCKMAQSVSCHLHIISYHIRSTSYLALQKHFSETHKEVSLKILPINISSSLKLCFRYKILIHLQKVLIILKDINNKCHLPFGINSGLTTLNLSAFYALCTILLVYLGRHVNYPRPHIKEILYFRISAISVWVS